MRLLIPLPEHLAIAIDGTFHARIEVEATPNIAIERHIHLHRDRDAGWLIYSIPNGAVEQAGDIVGGDIDVHDPTICTFLDSLFQLIADPDGVSKAEFRGRRRVPKRPRTGQGHSHASEARKRLCIDVGCRGQYDGGTYPSGTRTVVLIRHGPT